MPKVAPTSLKLCPFMPTAHTSIVQFRVLSISPKKASLKLSGNGGRFLLIPVFKQSTPLNVGIGRRAVIAGRAVRVKSQLKSHKRFATAFQGYCGLVDNARLYSTNSTGAAKVSRLTRHDQSISRVSDSLRTYSTVAVDRMEGRREQLAGGSRRDRLPGKGERLERRGQLRRRALPRRHGGGMAGPDNAAVEGAGAEGAQGRGPGERGTLPNRAVTH